MSIIGAEPKSQVICLGILHFGGETGKSPSRKTRAGAEN